MQINKRKIGETEINPVGLGCMNMTRPTAPAKKNDALNFLSKAIDLGYDFFDTATIYGLGENEKLVGEALKTNRNSFLIASKCVLGFADGKRFLDGRPSTIKAACEASLERLQTEVIDLYYMHRPDPKVPIEESVGALANLKKEGKIRMLGLSEMSAETLRKPTQASNFSDAIGVFADDTEPGTRCSRDVQRAWRGLRAILSSRSRLPLRRKYCLERT